MILYAAISLLLGAFVFRWISHNAKRICTVNGRRCEDPPMRPEPWYTFGLRGQLATVKASKAQRLPLRMVQMCDALGETWAYSLFGTRTIITRDQRNIQAVLATQFDDFGLATDRDAMHALLGTEAIFTQNGPAWSKSRALLRPSFDRAAVADLDRLEIFFTRMKQRIEETIPADRCMDMQTMYQKLTMDASSDFLLGNAVGALEEEGKDDGSGLAVQTFTGAFDVAQSVIAIRWALSNLYWVYNPRFFRDACSIVHTQVQRYVKRAIQLRTAGTPQDGKKKRYVFMEVLSESSQDPRVLQDQVLSVMLAGRDTTASLLSWTTLCLARHPEAQKKLRQAIRETIGDRIPTQAELRSITYLRWVLHEVLRLYPPLHANTRCATKYTTLPYGGGADGSSPIALAPGEKVIYSLFALHRRKDLYGDDADSFRPERWGEERVRKIGWGWLPFNGGPRICLGQQMALTHASYFVARMLQTFAVLEEDPKVVGQPVTFDAKITMYSGNGVGVRLVL
ncbi:putative cytochrome P450 alkane hydroxylase [Sphaerosporella brunnea]|uniref:Putative cytochrome P450 alkane hydroxylase n=1 Tax=Sphaerosporella brunnea TaxID=1250544 RepID=A0A5J5EEL6_9PEZI|nr:putative cytochrome P450 alkane hydroxylase [Sphaerosporella brunnea]